MTGANSTTSGLPSADSLTGEEIVGIIQDGSNVRTTLLDVSAYVASYIGGSTGYSNTPTIAIGQGTSAQTGGIAIGHAADARNSWAISIGGESYAAYSYTIALGVYATTTGEFDLAIGYRAKASYTASIAIGKRSHSYANNSIAIGTLSHALSQTSIAIGNQANVTATYSIGIGGEAYVSATNSIAIGVEARSTAKYSVVIGYDSSSDEQMTVAIGRHVRVPSGAFGSVAIGSQVLLNEAYSIGFGYQAQAYGNAAMAFGKYSKTLGDYTIAIGSETYAQGPSGIAIGRQAQSLTLEGVGGTCIAIGYQAIAKNNSSIAIGEEAYALKGSIAIGNNYNSASGVKALGYSSIAMMNGYAVGDRSISIGYALTVAPGGLSITTSQAENYGLGSILIGGRYSETTSNSGFSLSIGNEIYSNQANAVLLGNGITGNSKYGVSIGYESQIQNGYGAISIGWGAITNEAYGISIGAQSNSIHQNGIAIGYRSRTVADGSIAIGAYSYAQSSSVALGYNSSGEGQFAIAMHGTTASGTYGSIALGVGSFARYSGSMVFGQDAQDFCGGTMVTRGVETIISVENTPTKHEMKLTGSTVPGAQAGASFTGTGWNDIILAPTGNAANIFIMVVEDFTGTPNQNLSVSYADAVLTVGLATNGSGDVTTTLGQINAALPDGWNFVIAEGNSGTVASNGVPGNTVFDFAGGRDTVNTILTSNGNEPTTGNIPALPPFSICRVTGSVIGYDFHILAGSSTDAGTFALAPGFLICDHNGTYSFIGTPPVFTFELGTDGASDWEVPTLNIVENELLIRIASPNISANWLGFLTFEANT